MSFRWLRRLAREEQGAFLVEIMVSALLLALLTGGVMLSFDVAGKKSGFQRDQANAASFAQSKIEDLRSLKFTSLVGYSKSETVKIGETTFNWTAQADSALAPQAAAAGCDESARSPEALRVNVTVTWPGMGNRKPVQVTSIISAPVGGDASRGSFSVQILNREGYGVESIPVTLAGPSTATASTDSNGCVRFTDMLPSNAYKLTFQKENWFTTPDSRNAVEDAVSVIAGQTNTKSYQYDPGGPLVAEFFFKRSTTGSEEPSYQKAVTWEGTPFTTPLVQKFPDAPLPQISTGDKTFTTPKAYPEQSSPYGVYADVCTGARPPSPATLNPPTVPKARVQVPALDIKARNALTTAKVYVISGCTGLSFSGATVSNGQALLSSVFERKVESIPTAQAPSGQTGWVRVIDAGFPWGPNFYACIQRATDKKWRRTTAPISNVPTNNNLAQNPIKDVSFGDLDGANPSSSFESGTDNSKTLCGVQVIP